MSETGPQELQGDIVLPGSKSESNRALIIGALCEQPIEITNLSKASDTLVLQKALASKDKIVDIGDAGTAMRFLTAFLALKGEERVLTGSARMQQRPIKELVDGLTQLGANIEYLGEEGYPPLKFHPKTLKGATIVLSGKISSQYISALLMIGPNIAGGIAIELEDLVSRPYVEMTIEMMRHFGAQVDWKANRISVSENAYKTAPFSVESDWSAASYFYTLAALSGGANLMLCGLRENSLQGDAVIAELTIDFGVTTSFTKQGVRITKTQELAPEHFEYDFTNCPDLAQTIVPLCCGLRITGEFLGLQSLRIKETDRIAALAHELAKLGAVVTTSKSSIKVTGYHDRPAQASIATYNDHRMAMGFAPLALKYNNLIIKDQHVVEKSFPDFWDAMHSLGIHCG